jgi:hypothetical protein
VVGRRQRRCFRIEVLKQESCTPATASRKTPLARRVPLLPHYDTTIEQHSLRLSYHLAIEGRADTVVDTDTALNHSSSQVLHSMRAGESTALEPRPKSRPLRTVGECWSTSGLGLTALRAKRQNIRAVSWKVRSNRLAHAFIRIRALQIYKDCPSKCMITLLSLGDLMTTDESDLIS